MTSRRSSPPLSLFPALTRCHRLRCRWLRSGSTQLAMAAGHAVSYRRGAVDHYLALVGGDRPTGDAGGLAAVSAAVWFGFFFTVPYYRFTIRSSADITTAVLLVVTGLAVSQLAARARRLKVIAITDAAISRRSTTPSCWLSRPVCIQQ